MKARSVIANSAGRRPYLFDKGTHKDGVTPARLMQNVVWQLALNGVDVKFLGHGNVGWVDHGHVDSSYGRSMRDFG